MTAKSRERAVGRLCCPKGLSNKYTVVSDRGSVHPFGIYRDEIYSLQILLSRTQAGPGRTVKREQEEISPNHVQIINLISVKRSAKKYVNLTKQDPGRARQNR